MAGVEDMVLLSTVTEDSVVKNLKSYFDKDRIYTNIGPVLIVCNPFKWLKLYEPSTIELYEKGSSAGEELPPHIFAVAENAFRTMLYEEEKQCVIISGESGAGKTEAAKQIMAYVAAVSGSGANDAAVTEIKNVILESNPALESFGNAMTLRNNNSSRFGKYFEINFDLANGGTPTGGFITNYLLEKSRIVKPGKGERGFHIFYQLLAAANKTRKDLKTKLQLGTWKDYEMLKNTGVGVINNEGGKVDDLEEFEQTIESLSTIGVTPEEQTEFFRIVAICLHLSTIKFVGDGTSADGSVVENQQALSILAQLLGIQDMRAIEHALTSRTLYTSGETYQVQNNPTQAKAARDAFAKSLYNRLFDLLVSRINDCLKSCGAKTNIATYKSSRHQNLEEEEDYDPFALSIGVLDIYGFEIFSVNLFEQFCINYVNEKLQQVFINLTIKSEQEDYSSEGIEWTPIPFFDNQVVCDLVEGKRPPGIFPLLDDTCKTMAKMQNVDGNFLGKVQQFQRSNKHLKLGHPGVFTLTHYAGDVEYTVSGFIESNKDLLGNDLKLLAQSSGSSFIRELYPETVDFANSRAPTTAGFKIRNQCGALVNALLACNPHYVRCIKSNASKMPKKFESSLVKHQVRYLGLLENIKVRRAGFAYRVEFFKFAARFRVLASGKLSHILANGSDKDIANAVLQSAMTYVPVLKNPGEAQLGKRKIFIKHPETVFELQKIRKSLMSVEATKIQKLWRRYKSRVQLTSLREEMELLWQDNAKQATPVDLVRPFSSFYIRDRALNASISGLLEFVGKYEKLQYADIVTKINKNNQPEKTVIFFTNLAFYYGSHQGSGFYLQRRTDLKEVEGIMLSKEADDYIGIRILPQQMLASPNTTHFLEKKSVKRCMETQTKFAFFGRHRHRCYQTGGIYIRESVATTVPLPDLGYYKPQHVHKSVVGKINVEMREDLVFVTEKKAEMAGVLRDLVSRAKGEVVPVQSNSVKQPKARPAPSASQKRMCKALYDYQSQQPDELSLKIEDRIEILDSSDRDWWSGKLNGQTGLFPANYVEELKSAPPPPPPSASSGSAENQRNYRVNITFENNWQIRRAPFESVSNTLKVPVVFSRNNTMKEVFCDGNPSKNAYEVFVPPGVAADVLKQIRYNQQERARRREQERQRLEEERQRNAKRRQEEREADRQRRLEERKAKRKELQKRNGGGDNRPSWAQNKLRTVPSNDKKNNAPVSYAQKNNAPVSYAQKNNLTLQQKASNGVSQSRPAMSQNRPAIPQNRPTIPSTRPTGLNSQETKTVVGTGTMSYEQVLGFMAKASKSQRSSLELLLTPAAFQDVFGMAIEDFQKLPKWKQTQRKKDKKLF